MVAKCDGPISGFMEITHDGPIWTAYTFLMLKAPQPTEILVSLLDLFMKIGVPYWRLYFGDWIGAYIYIHMCVLLPAHVRTKVLTLLTICFENIDISK